MIPSRTITLFEHQSLPYHELGRVADHTLIEGLEILNQESGIEIIQLGRKSLKASHYVGVIRVGNTTFQILPKIDYAPDGNPDASVGSTAHQIAVQSATINLLFLLSYTHQLRIYEQDIASLASRRADWFELLTRILASDLHRLMQRGLYRSYVTVEEMLDVMRGRWQISRQLSQQPHVRHRFDMQYDEFSPDIPLNRVFRFVVEHLLPRTQDHNTRNLLTDIYQWLQPARRLGAISPELLERIHFTRLNERYLPGFNLARLFLEHSTFQLSTGTRRIFAFVFDMERLFEKFVEAFVMRHRTTIFPVSWSRVQIHPQAKGQKIYLAKTIPEERLVFLLKPDMLFTYYGSNVLILDTKYKQLTTATRIKGISENDLYQMLAYASRLECLQTIILYPQTAQISQERLQLQAIGYPGQLFIATLNLRQSLSKPTPIIQEFKEIFQPISIPIL